MPDCSISEIKIDGRPAVRLDNGLVRADVVPEFGGRIWNLWHAPSGTQWLWHRPKRKLRAPKPDAAHEEEWPGGWEQAFPNEQPGRFQGRDLADHGEWWSRDWEWEIQEKSEHRVVLHLWHDGAQTPTRCQKWISLEPGSSELKVRYRIQHMGSGKFYFLFKEDLALAVGPEHRIELPGGQVTPIEDGTGHRLASGGSYVWPVAEDKSRRPVDLSTLPPKTAKLRDHFYVYDMPDGWCGVRNALDGHFLRIRYPRVIFPYTWILMSLGGWKGYYTVVLQPCTNMPRDMSAALQAGRCASLDSFGVMEADLSVELG